MTTCLVCGRPLTDTASVVRQVGPVCLARLNGHSHTTSVARPRRRRLDVDQPLTGFPDLTKGTTTP